MTDEEKAYVISLVRAHLITESEYKSWVPPYTKVRWASVSSRCVAERVGGHWRRFSWSLSLAHAFEALHPAFSLRNSLLVLTNCSSVEASLVCKL